MDFEEYWKNFGKLEDEVTKNCQPNSKLEEDFRKFAEKIWSESVGHSENSYEKRYSEGWDECEEHYIREDKLTRDDLF